MTDLDAIRARHAGEHYCARVGFDSLIWAGPADGDCDTAIVLAALDAERQNDTAAINAVNAHAREAENRLDAAIEREARLRAALTGFVWLGNNLHNIHDAPYHFKSLYEAALDDARAALATTPEGETAWLVERGQSMKQVPTVWWTGDEHAPEYGWTTDAYRALRFPSREAATAYIEERSPLPKNRDRWAVAVEHGFIAALATGVGSPEEPTAEAE